MSGLDLQPIVIESAKAESLKESLVILCAAEEATIAEAANELVGQFSAAEVDGKIRIYHVSIESDESGNEQEYAEWIMNEGDELIKFVAWFFSSHFELKQKDVYQLAGKTYKQPSRK
jgi:hypothetical protein